jgi:hypothetical protein
MPPSPYARLYPEPVPGGSLIGSVNSRFTVASSALYQSKYPITAHSQAPTYTSFNSDYTQSGASVKGDLTNIIQALSRPKIESLVTQAWIRNISNQSEEKLRDLVVGAVKKGILSRNDVHNTCTNSFTCLPTEVS